MESTAVAIVSFFQNDALLTHTPRYHIRIGMSLLSGSLTDTRLSLIDTRLSRCKSTSHSTEPIDVVALE